MTKSASHPRYGHYTIVSAQKGEVCHLGRARRPNRIIDKARRLVSTAIKSLMPGDACSKLERTGIPRPRSTAVESVLTCLDRTSCQEISAIGHSTMLFRPLCLKVMGSTAQTHHAILPSQRLGATPQSPRLPFPTTCPPRTAQCPLGAMPAMDPRQPNSPSALRRRRRLSGNAARSSSSCALVAGVKSAVSARPYCAPMSRSLLSTGLTRRMTP